MQCKYICATKYISKILTYILFIFFSNKERINKTIEKINMMKKLIVNFIAASSHMLNEPFYVQMLEDHRELVNFETILKISQNSEITNENS